MPPSKVSYSVVEELSSIKNLFGYQIEPDINRMNLDVLKEDISIIIEFRKYEEDITSSDQVIKLKLLLKIPELYPHDLPEINLFNINGLTGNQVNELSNIVTDKAKIMCGQFMLTDVLLIIEDYLAGMSKSQQHLENMHLSDLDKPSSSADEHSVTDDLLCNNFCTPLPLSCINEKILSNKVLKLKSFVNLAPLTYQFSACAFHHCGTCNFTGVICREEFSVYSFRSWKFSLNSATQDTKQDHLMMERSLLHLSDTINNHKIALHENLLSNPHTFIHSFENDFYFFLAYPLNAKHRMPLCMYLDNLTEKVSERNVHSILKQSLSALYHLHRNQIVHGSFYTCNILVDADLKVIIQDGGLVHNVWKMWKESHLICDEHKSELHTHHFEMFSKFITPTMNGDIFSFGLVAFSLAECKIYNTAPIRISPFVNKKFDGFLAYCFSQVEENCGSVYKLLQHPYITDFQPSEAFWNEPEPGNRLALTQYHRPPSRLLNEFEIIKIIGKGAFGTVVLVKNRIDCCIYAVKRIVLKNKDPDERNHILREVQIMSRLNHPNVARYYNSWVEYQNINWFVENDENEVNSNTEPDIFDEISSASLSEDHKSDDSVVFEDSKQADSSQILSKNTVECLSENPSPIYLFMQMEFCEQRSLRELIATNTLHTNEKMVWQIFRDIATGLAYIHSEGMIHRDIKPENILLSSINHAKIVDFNLATLRLSCKPNQNVNPNDKPPYPVKCSASASQVGTFPYMAPEIECTNGKDSITPAIDLYSLGIVFFEMWHTNFVTSFEKYKVILNLRNNKIVDEIDDPVKKDIIFGLLKNNPKERLTAEALLTSTVYPFTIEVLNVNTVAQHVLCEPRSVHSRKLLNTFFTHEQNTDIRDTYLSEFFFDDPQPLVWSTLARKCMFRFLDSFLRKRGCLDMLCPTFYPFHDKNIFSKLSSLTFIDSFGTRVCLNTHFLSHLFDLVSKIDPEDLYNLPISRFGGIHHAFSPDPGTKFSHHPFIHFEYYYANVCTTLNTNVCVVDCICESVKLIDNFVNASERLHDVGASSSDENVAEFDTIEVSINHVLLLVLLLLHLGLNEEDASDVLTFLATRFVSSDSDKLSRAIETLCNQKLTLLPKRDVLISLLTFRGNIQQFIQFLTKILKIKHHLPLMVYVENVRNLVGMIRSTLGKDISVVIELGLYFNIIWLPDNILFKIEGIHQRNSHKRRSVITSGGLYRYHLRNVKFWDSKVLDALKLFGSESNESETKSEPDLTIVYSSISLKPLLDYIEFLHSHRICLCHDENMFHDMIVICYESIDGVTPDYSISNQIADALRLPPYNFVVYVYNHPLTYDHIRKMRLSLNELNVFAVLCFKPHSSSARVFLISNDCFDEINAENYHEAGDIVKSLIKTDAKPTKRAVEKTLNKSSTQNKDKEIIFLYADNQHSTLSKQQESKSLNFLNAYNGIFHPSCKFIIILADLNQAEYTSLLTDYDFMSFVNGSQPPKTPHKPLSHKVSGVLQLIKNNPPTKFFESVYFLHNTKTGQFKPLF